MSIVVPPCPVSDGSGPGDQTRTLFFARSSNAGHHRRIARAGRRRGNVPNIASGRWPASRRSNAGRCAAANRACSACGVVGPVARHPEMRIDRVPGPTRLVVGLGGEDVELGEVGLGVLAALRPSSISRRASAGLPARMTLRIARPRRTGESQVARAQARRVWVARRRVQAATSAAAVDRRCSDPGASARDDVGRDPREAIARRRLQRHRLCPGRRHADDALFHLDLRGRDAAIDDLAIDQKNSEFADHRHGRLGCGHLEGLARRALGHRATPGGRGRAASAWRRDRRARSRASSAGLDRRIVRRAEDHADPRAATSTTSPSLRRQRSRHRSQRARRSRAPPAWTDARRARNRDRGCNPPPEGRPPPHAPCRRGRGRGEARVDRAADLVVAAQPHRRGRGVGEGLELLLVVVVHAEPPPWRPSAARNFLRPKYNRSRATVDRAAFMIVAISSTEWP